ncbi:hypothetical protein [Paenibacillus sp. MMO-177]|uniref:hypothetical protein n=1 Tax=Paenibacillus sp. MMO-177 TaxID=3081289 RepID=UPI003017F3FB
MNDPLSEEIVAQLYQMRRKYSQLFLTKKPTGFTKKFPISCDTMRAKLTIRKEWVRSLTVKPMTALPLLRAWKFIRQTHRGRITQDLIRTTGYIQAIPQFALTIDLSHYVLAGELSAFDQPSLTLIVAANGCLNGSQTICGRKSNRNKQQKKL